LYSGAPRRYYPGVEATSRSRLRRYWKHGELWGRQASLSSVFCGDVLTLLEVRRWVPYLGGDCFFGFGRCL